MKKFKLDRWIQLNILLPLSPFFLKVFIIWMGKEQNTSKIKIFETPELLFFSIATCVIALNINIDGEKKYFEHLVRTFLMVIMVLDFVMLGMIYSGNEGTNSTFFSIVVAVIPMVIAPIYQLYFLNNEDKDKERRYSNDVSSEL